MKGFDEAGRGEMSKKFFADAMLGRLATWMRIIGCDVAYERDIEDSVLVIKALTEGRVILTRDRLLTRRRGVRGRTLFIESDRVVEQLRQVIKRFGIKRSRVLTRCIRCNIGLVNAEKEGVRGLVPEYVYESQERFSRCPGCSRIYWAGTHKGHINRVLDRVFGDDGG
jgi:uncharacterized protein with PIN domain